MLARMFVTPCLNAMPLSSRSKIVSEGSDMTGENSDQQTHARRNHVNKLGTAVNNSHRFEVVPLPGVCGPGV